MRFWEIGKRNLKELYRDPVALGFLLGMPLAFILIFSTAMGGQATTPINITVVDEDQTQTSMEFMTFLKNTDALNAEDIYYQESQAEEGLRTGEIYVYLVIPEGFEQAKQNNQFINLELAYKAADPMLAQRVEPVVRAITFAFWEVPFPPVSITTKGTEVEIEDEYINFLIPGMTVFGLMILVTTAGGIMVRDKTKGFLSRMLTTPARPWDFILGYTLPFVPIILISIMIYLGVGIGMGLSIVGNFGLAFLIFFIIGMCCLGIGMILGTLAKTEDQAAGIPWVVIVPLAMVSGAWWPVEMMPDVVQNIIKVFPFFHAMKASREVITASASFTAILPDFYWLIGWMIVLFATGVVLFRRSMSR